MTKNRFFKWYCKQVGEPYCFFCEKWLTIKTATKDHLVPLSKGGKDEDCNIVLSCRWCNRTKGNLTYEEIDITSITKMNSYYKFSLLLKHNRRLIRSGKNYFIK